ncbi:MAG: right-handed parallel beta-helix repeat-containing protein [Anaerolineales bacterium]
MTDRSRAFFISLSILALVLFSAFGTIPVYADDGTTSDSTETATVTGTEPVATEQPTSDPSTVVNDEQQPPADGTTPTTETQPVVEETPLLEQVPDNITVTVVDETGEAQPLVSQDSAEAVLLSDPIWCPAGQAPTPGANGCTQSYTSFTQLLDFLKANEGDAAYQQDGTIYVQQGTYAGGEQSIDFNSYNFTEINKKNLTVTGGWNTTTNEVNSTSSFNVPIIIGSSGNPWGGSVTLNNIIINGAADQTGLTLYSNGNIELSNVEVTNSQNGAEIDAKGNVTINNSKFHKNKEKGADITVWGQCQCLQQRFQ